MDSLKNKRRSGRWRRSRIFVWIILIIVLGPSVVNLTRATVACRMWEKPQVDDSGSKSKDEALKNVTQKIPDYARPEDATYLTFPEWYVVYSTDEYAAFIAKHPPSQFPYFGAIDQYWQGWYDVCAAMRGRYPLDGGYQFALVVIGTNFTAENTIRGLYEFTFGHLTELLSSGAPTEEELFAQQTAREYGDFIHMTPWFDFPFSEKLKGLWKTTSLWGPDPIRKWERKLVLTVDYGTKTFYGWLIHLGTNLVYGGPDDLKVYAVAGGTFTENPDLQLIQKIDDQQNLITLTRFEVFTRTVPGFTANGLRFIEIAGNDEILVSLFAPRADSFIFQHAEYLFDLPVLTDPALTRVAVKVRVTDLHLFLQELKNGPIRLEHIYDY